MRERRIAVWIFEQAGAKFQGQHPRAGRIDQRLLDTPFVHRVDQRRKRHAFGQFAVDPGNERLARCVLEIVGYTMKCGQFVHAAIIADDRAIEAPFSAQDLSQQPSVGVAGNTIDLVIARHDAADGRTPDDFAKWGEEVLSQVAFRNLGRSYIVACFGLAVAGHMLECCEDLAVGQLLELAFTLQTLDGRYAHFPDQIGVLAPGFLDPTPTRITDDVDNRAQDKGYPARANLARGRRLNPPHQVEIETPCERDRLREHGRFGRHVAVQRFLMQQYRNAEARVLQRPTLKRIDELDRLLGRAPASRGASCRSADAGHTALVAGSGDVPDPVREGCTRALRNECQIVDHVALRRPGGADLRDLFLQRHARHQVGYAGRDRCCSVPVKRPCLRQSDRGLRYRDRGQATPGKKLQRRAATDAHGCTVTVTS